MAARAQIAMHRHLHAMSEKDIDAVVQAVADLIVNYFARNPESLRRSTSTPTVPRPNQQAAQVKETQA
jgi:hypothetical protein